MILNKVMRSKSKLAEFLEDEGGNQINSHLLSIAINATSRHSSFVAMVLLYFQIFLNPKDPASSKVFLNSNPDFASILVGTIMQHIEGEESATFLVQSAF